MNKLPQNFARNFQDLENRKHHHLEMAENSQTQASLLYKYFSYEPLFGVHPPHIDEDIFKNHSLEKSFLGKVMQFPLWISSMTGGTGNARHINQNLAQAVCEFKLGMGLGSVRSLLETDEFFLDFNLRSILGDDRPFFGNLGICQLEQLLREKNIMKLHDLVGRLRLDGMIIHVNPLQEFYQIGGDRLTRPAIHTLQEFIEIAPYKIIVKEVGQGMGPRSLKALLKMPLAAIDFAGFGGTNFSYLEWKRRSEQKEQDKPKNEEKTISCELGMVGHTAHDMVIQSNIFACELGDELRCSEIIISGGIKNYLIGYRLINMSRLNAVYGQGMAILQHADGEYIKLKKYLESEFQGLLMANEFLDVLDVLDVKGTN